jgi:hypothetical protein
MLRLERLPFLQGTNPSRTFVLRSLFVFLAVVANLVQDYLDATLNEGGYYLSESLLFSSFWLFFLPGYRLQGWLARRLENRVLLVLAPVLMHLVLYPLFVYLASACLLDFGFRPVQTALFSLSQYGLVLLAVYAGSLFLGFRKESAGHSGQAETEPVETEDLKTAPYEFSVTEGNRTSRVAASEVLYLTASTPYVALHTLERKYLLNDTLRSLEADLVPEGFIRIHRSVIVNLQWVKSYTSRLNGDYDLTLSDGSSLRLSRHYAADFKRAFAQKSTT